MTGILKIAFKLLVNDKAKFAALIVGITFAMFLMVQLTSIFAGILQKASANVINVGARFWVMDPAVNNPLNSIPMPDYVLDFGPQHRRRQICRAPVFQCLPGQTQ